MNRDPHHWVPIAAALIVIVAAAAVYIGYLRALRAPMAENDVAGPAPQESSEPATLGEAIYEKSSNPVQGALPDTVAPVANPLSGAYRNPFQ